MAYKISNKHPLDNQKRKIVGFSLPMSNSAVFNPTYSTKDQLRSNLINYFMTNKGERICNPFFGADLKKFLFENIDDITLDVLNKKIKTEIKLYFPNILLKDIKIDTNKDRNYFRIQIFYSVAKFGIEDNINLEIG